MSALRWTWRGVRYDQQTFWRTPGPFFAIAMPVMMLLIFGNLNQDGTMDDLGGGAYSSYLAIGMVAFAVAATAYGNLLARITYRRETGIYRRLQATPLPSAALLGGAVLSTLLVIIIGISAVLVTGRVLFDASLPSSWPLFAAAVLMGAAACGAIGVAASAMVHSAETVDTVAMATMMPILFISGVFQYIDPSTFLGRIGALFPPHHILMITADASDVPTTGGGAWGHLAVLTTWTLIAGVIAARRFRWAPTRS